MSAEIEDFIRDAARKRGIDPDIAVRVARSEGGVDEPARRGTFETGSSWWPFQLHYGGKGYEHFGTVAGMGNGFTELTGWQPGDPNAWRDSVRYALNRAKASGWGAWYGAAHVGIGPWDGIDRNHPWDAGAERWDYETGGGTVPKVTYNRDEPAIPQNDSWSCAPTATRWAMKTLGRNPAESWMESQMQADGVVSTNLGLLDASGRRLAEWITAQYGELGYSASHENPIGFQALAAEFGPGNPYPGLLGGRRWNHWAGLKSYDPGRDVLLLANPSEGWQGVGQTMNRQQFVTLGPFSLVRVLHPDLLEPTAPPSPPPPPPPPPVQAISRADLDALLVEARAQVARIELLRDRLPA